jgi:hypothetical protein
MKRLFFTLFLFSLSAFAADVSGTWKVTAEGPNGSMERTFTFKVDGGKLTGETNSSMLGKSEISDGKVDGDNVSFTINIEIQGNAMKISYKGKVHGDDIDLTAEVGDSGQTIDWKGKRVP